MESIRFTMKCVNKTSEDNGGDKGIVYKVILTLEDHKPQHRVGLLMRQDSLELYVHRDEYDSFIVGRSHPISIDLKTVIEMATQPAN